MPKATANFCFFGFESETPSTIHYFNILIDVNILNVEKYNNLKLLCLVTQDSPVEFE